MSVFQYNLAKTELLTQLLSRRSYWPLVGPVPTEDELHQVFEATMRAPDHSNLKPWRFFTIQGEALSALGDIFAAAAVKRGDDDNGDRSRRQAVAAPMIIAVGARIYDDERVPEVEQILSVGAAAMNLLNALHLFGYGAYWATGPNAYDPDVRNALGLKEASDQLLGFIYVGSPSKQRAPKVRPSSETLVTPWSHSLA
ncbi:nitroreductase [Pseudomonas sp. SLFW]|uniref:nitroreductase family protein n=1 Tax=Pseudomonas TaxID=286 RepID=UPI0014126939|nr:nitroreductase [Pseudomonas sp. SLFW]NBB09885.1 nitroreductase [Pseudomonas sp. SLFW]